MSKKMTLVRNFDLLKTSSPIQSKKLYDENSIDLDIQRNLTYLVNTLGQSSDFKYREIETTLSQPTSLFISYLFGMASEDYINSYIVKALRQAHFPSASLLSTGLFSVVKKQVLNVAAVKETYHMDVVIDSILLGKTVIFLPGFNKALVAESQEIHTRQIEEPDTEANVRGSREGFTEDITLNTTLIRKRIRNSDLTLEDMNIGKNAKTVVRLIYMKGFADEHIVHEVKQRLKSIKQVDILESGYIEQLIEDYPYSLFPTIANSEKPDKVVGKILKGRVAILCEGTPFVLTLPHLFIENFQVHEDYSSKFYISSLVRLFRIISLFLTVLTPALFVAVSTFHQEMIPSVFLVTIAASEERVPFPLFLEAMVMIFLFELLKEAGVRMPRPIGSAVTIVGALILGEAAVQAGVVSAPMVIVVALTAITGFIVSSLNSIIVLSRFLLLFAGGLFGFFGILMGSIILLAHACSLRSFGVPYLEPFGPIVLSELKDSIIRFPLQKLKSKPEHFIREDYEQHNTEKHSESSITNHKD
ncbi:spore germination protein [Bacillus sp. A301a_S52]|nr:spore germination protein [Bacillus sp. A301a_S52]